MTITVILKHTNALVDFLHFNSPCGPNGSCLWMGSSTGRTNCREGVQPVVQHNISDRRAVLNMTNFFLLSLCFNHTELKVNPGQDAPLQCQGPRDAEITLLEWNRADLKSDDYVFMYRNQRPYESYQHESFKGRVDLMDPSMKDGNVSVTLRDVRINDTGTYKCQITTKETESVVHECSINLTVTTSGKFVEVELGVYESAHCGMSGHQRFFHSGQSLLVCWSLGSCLSL